MKSSLKVYAGCLLTGTVFTLNALSAQQVTCATNRAMEAAFAANPSLRAEYETQMQAIRDMPLPPEGQEAAPKVIPVVFHIIHNYGAENISEAQVQDAIAGLNADFQMLNADTSAVIPEFQHLRGNANVEFRLARLDPNGNCTNGITRTVSPLTERARENVKSLISWPRNKYLNIWVVRSIESFGSGEGIIAGYAYLPGSAPTAGVDGVLLDYRYTGGIGGSNGSNFARRTISHEVGHWLGLEHTWGSNDNCGNSCSTSNDGIDDTPATIGNCSTCNLYNTTCGSLDNVQNIMDYSTCASMFTKGQATRINQVLNSSSGERNKLWTSSNLIATGTNDGFVQVACAPVADFHTQILSACAGSTINFTDFSWKGTPTSWNWTFTNGLQTYTSSLQNPQITFNDTGTYNVTLTVSNAQGSHSITRNGYIRIYDSGIVNQHWIYYDAMENAPIGSGRWYATWSSNPSKGWQEHPTVGANSPGCVYIPNFSNSRGYVYNLISPAYDLSTINGPLMMYWKHAYAKRGNGSDDQLRIMVSNNCGQGWSLRKTLSANDLATRTNTNTSFTPSATQWKMDSLTNLSSWTGQTHVLFRFEFTTGGGNNFYLDDINISGPLAIEEAEGPEDLSWEIYPNPATGPVQMRWWLQTENPVSIRILDVTGRVCMQIPQEQMEAGWQEINFDVSGMSGGLYMVQMQLGNRTFTRRLIVH